jgi:cyanophycin synthetase
LALYSKLALWSGIPVFETGELVGAARSPQQKDLWIFDVIVPFVDGMSHATAHKLLRLAFKLVNSLADQAQTPDAVDRLYQQISPKQLAQQFNRIPGGKSTVPVCQVAHALGIPFRHHGGGLIHLGWGAKSGWMDRSSSRKDSAMGARATSDKKLTAVLLSHAGLPAPVHRLVKDTNEAQLAAIDIGWPVVVKPANLERGEGVSIDIRDEQQLRAAFDKARALSARVLVERQVPGFCHRLFVIGDKVNIAVKRLPKHITGDGLRSIQEIVDAFNDANIRLPPWERKFPLEFDAVAMACLHNAGFDTNSVAAEGQMVALRPIESTEWGGEIEDMIDSIHPENIRVAVLAAAVLGLHVAGVDMISADIRLPWHSNGAIINEVNFAPFFSGKLDPARSNAFIKSMVQGDGRIPVWAVLGQGLLLAAGQKLAADLRAEGLQAFVTSATHTENALGHVIAMNNSSLFERCAALTMHSEVQALVMVVEDDEILRYGMPFDRINKIFISGNADLLKDNSQHQSLLRRLRLYMPRTLK